MFLLAIGLIVDSFNQVRLFAQGGYLDAELRGKVFEAIWKLTLGGAILAGFGYFIYQIFED